MALALIVVALPVLLLRPTVPPCAVRARGTVAVALHAPSAELERLPDAPTPDVELSAAETARAVCMGLQHNNYPRPDAGIERLYHFLQPQGRVAIAPPAPNSGLQGFVSLEDFLRDAGSPALGSLILCDRFELLGEPTITPGNNFRGAFATVAVDVHNDMQQEQQPAPDNTEEAVLEALIAAPDDYLQRVLDAARRGRTPPPLPLKTKKKPTIPRRACFIVKLEQERRPPLQGCWLIKEFHSTQRTAFQVMNEGGEEFEGEES